MPSYIVGKDRQKEDVWLASDTSSLCLCLYVYIPIYSAVNVWASQFNLHNRFYYAWQPYSPFKKYFRNHYKDLQFTSLLNTDTSQQGSWGQPTGPRWAPCWPHELCYLGFYTSCGNKVIDYTFKFTSLNPQRPMSSESYTKYFHVKKQINIIKLYIK